jgi:hypothetical protein
MHYIEIHAERGHIGKTTVAGRVRNLFEDAGQPVEFIRIEGRNAGPAERPNDQTVLVEDLIAAKGQPGGVAGALGPLWDILDRPNIGGEPGAIILDYGGNTGDIRKELGVVTALAPTIVELGVTGVMITVTINEASVMRQAAADLLWNAAASPGFLRILVQNEVGGPFKFPHGTDSHKALRELEAAGVGAQTVVLPLIGGGAWSPFADAGISMPEAINGKARELAPRIRLDRYRTQACMSYLASWYTTTEQGFRRALGFPKAAA